MIEHKNNALENNTPETNIRRARLVPRGNDDTFKINKTGQKKIKMGDLYIRLISASWANLLQSIIVIYLCLNILFALAYLVIGNNIENARTHSLTDAFFFSVQTFSTIGYGKMAPIGIYANTIVTIEVLTGFIFFSVITGLIFSKFSRPTARVLFSNVAVICPYNGKPHFMIRLANERNNRIIDANIHAVMLCKEQTHDGHFMRRFYDLHLTRNRVPLLQLTWTLMHLIDENSPLWEMTQEKLQEQDIEILVSLVGIDETFSQTIHARWSYISSDIKYNAVYVDVIKQQNINNGIDIDYTHFHETVTL